MQGSQTLLELIPRLRAGDPEAQQLIYERYQNRLLRLAGRQLGRDLKRHVSPEDIMVMALKSVLVYAGKRELTLDHQGSLWGLVSQVARRKICDQRPARPVTDEMPPTPASDDWSPEELARWSDALELIQSRLKPREFLVVALKVQGYTTSEIGKQLGVARQTVNRWLERIEAMIRRLLEGPAEVYGETDEGGNGER